MTTVQMNASAIGGTLQLPYSGTVVVPANGIITVDSRDVPPLLTAGAKYISSKVTSQDLGIVLAGAAGAFVASVAFANGTLTIAAQPDVSRLASVRIDPGTTALTAGNVAVNYLANDGTTLTDNFSAVTPASTVASANTSRGVAHINSVIVTGAAGGTSPKIQMDSLNSLALAVDPGFYGFTGLKASVDDADVGIASVQSTAACITPSTAPNGTHTFELAGAYNA
jgi:hypothetical protein